MAKSEFQLSQPIPQPWADYTGLMFHFVLSNLDVT